MIIQLALVTTFFVIIDGSLGISHGEEKSIENYPFMAFMGFCGGAIISKDIVITAAHCLRDDSAVKYIKIQVGMSNKEDNVSEHSVESYKRHEGFRMNRWTYYSYHGKARYPTTAYNDVALMKVKPPFVFNEKIQPIALFNAGEKIKSGSTGTLLGWGEIAYDEHLPPGRDSYLRGVDIPIVDKDVCLRQLQQTRNYTLLPGEMCAGGKDKGNCEHDSGGPLVVNGRLAGVVSWGPTCGQVTNNPAVYSEIAYFREWIDETLKKLTGEAI